MIILELFCSLYFIRFVHFKDQNLFSTYSFTIIFFYFHIRGYSDEILQSLGYLIYRLPYFIKKCIFHLKVVGFECFKAQIIFLKSYSTPPSRIQTLNLRYIMIIWWSFKYWIAQPPFVYMYTYIYSVIL